MEYVRAGPGFEPQLFRLVILRPWWFCSWGGDALFASLPDCCLGVGFKEVYWVIFVIRRAWWSLLSQAVFFRKVISGAVPWSRSFVIWWPRTQLSSTFLLRYFSYLISDCCRRILFLVGGLDSVVIGSRRLGVSFPRALSMWLLECAAGDDGASL